MYKNQQIELLVLPAVQNIKDITKDLNVKITKAHYSNIEFIFKDNKVSILHKGRDINTFTAVWLSSHWSTRELASTVKQYLDSHNIPTTYVENNTSKITDTLDFAFGQLPIPNTYYVKDSQVLKHIEDIENVCNYPMIMKPTKGFGGKNTTLLNSRKDLLKAISTRKEQHKYMFQEFIPNEYDWGVMVVNDKVVSGEKSYPKCGEFRNNCSNGATEIFVDPKKIPEDIKEIAMLGARSLSLSWSRADIIIDKNTQKPYLLEVNRFPGITKGTTEVSGAKEFLTNYLEANGLLSKSHSNIQLPVLGIHTEEENL